MKGGIFWIVYNQYPFCEYQMFSDKPVLIKSPSGYENWVTKEDREPGISFSRDMVVSLFTQEEITELIRNSKCIKVFIGSAESEIKIPTSPEEQDIFKQGAAWIVNET